MASENEITENGSKNEPRKLSTLMIPLAEVRAAIVEEIRKGKKEMDLESFLLMVREVYRNT